MCVSVFVCESVGEGESACDRLLFPHADFVKQRGYTNPYPDPTLGLALALVITLAPTITLALVMALTLTRISFPQIERRNCNTSLQACVHVCVRECVYVFVCLFVCLFVYVCLFVTMEKV